ncbi:MAG: DUF1501 domain-containing protein, partial [Gemmataceae bacterium]|nr:DUF1501 domain-containing protein [Gemmataceae bacterium]
MNCSYACQSPEHTLTRRRFLASASAGTLGLLGFGNMAQPAATKALAASDKRVLVVWLAGASSQLETWDPKPGTDTGGPFKAIQTSVPGVQVCELLPYTAKQMHRMALVRGVNTANDDHGQGEVFMQTGRRPDPAMQYPRLGAAVSKLLGSETQALPGYIHVVPRGGSGFGSQDAAFLGPKYASLNLGDGKPPDNLLRPTELSEEADRQRREFQDRLNKRFTERRRTAETETYTHSYEQAAQLMKQKRIFDISTEAPRYLDRYVKHDFGRH